jgi:TM2 domain-containing membrane protein YozV
LPVPYPPPAAAYDQPGYYQPGYGQPGQAMAGVDPVTGQPFSDKSKIVAGLLQLGLGFFTLGGVGRLYAGNTTVGVIQIVASLIAWICFICGFFVFVTWPIWFVVWLWSVIDAIVILAGRPVDGQGRPLHA